MNLEPVGKEIYLKLEAPALHFFVKIFQVRIILNRLKIGKPAKIISNHFCE
jgi:hypothetical protein